MYILCIRNVSFLRGSGVCEMICVESRIERILTDARRVRHGQLRCFECMFGNHSKRLAGERAAECIYNGGLPAYSSSSLPSQKTPAVCGPSSHASSENKAGPNEGARGWSRRDELSIFPPRESANPGIRSHEMRGVVSVRLETIGGNG